MKWLSPAAMALAAACSAPAAASTLTIIYDTASEGTRTLLQAPVPVAGGRIIGQSFGFQDHGQIYLLTPAAPGAPYTKSAIHNFAFNDKPSGNLTPDAAGNLWGTTNYNGDNNNGWLFELVKPAKPSGAWTYRYAFSLPDSLGASNSNGYGNMIFDKAGNLYGLSIGGTIANNCHGTGCGAIWEIPAATLAGGSVPITTLVTIPASLLVATNMARDTHGRFYGVGQVNQNPGVVWEARARRGGTYAIRAIHTFCSIRDPQNNCTDGYNPSSIIVGSSGTLYGTTYSGGANPGCSNGTTGHVSGIVFSLKAARKNKWTFAVVHDFLWFDNNCDATADISLGAAVGLTLSATNLLVTAQQGGSNDCTVGSDPGAGNCSIYEGGLVSVTISGADAIVNNSFASSDGSPPIAGPSGPMFKPILGAKGTILGASADYYIPASGYTGNGVIYSITP